jgi:hypothetical protein
LLEELRYGSRTYTPIRLNLTFHYWLLGKYQITPYFTPYLLKYSTPSVLTILLPTAFFASLDRGAQSIATNGIAQYSGQLLTDNTRREILRMSRGLAVVLLIMCVFKNAPHVAVGTLILPLHQIRHVENLPAQSSR